MALIHFSSVVTENCSVCDNKRFVDVSPGDIERGGPLFYIFTTRWGGKPCHDCASCWYIYDHVGGFVSASHRPCSDLFPDDVTLQIPYEECKTWVAPAGCKMADIATRLVQSYRGWELDD